MHFFIVLLVFSCSDEQNTKVNDDLTAIPDDLGGLYLGGFVAPPGTKAVLSDGGRVLTYTLPEGYVYAGLGKDQSLVTLTSGCYQSTSYCNNGCDVVRLGDTVGCSACDPNSTGSKVCTGSPCDVMQMMDEGGIVNTLAGIKFVERAADISGLRNDLPAWKVLEKMEVVQNELSRFITETWGDRVLAEDGKWVVVNFFGAAAKMLVPSDYATARTLSAQNTSWNCTQGSGCTYEAVYRMGIKVGEICRSGGGNNCQMIYQ